MNKIILKKPIVRNSRVTAVYEVEGEWREAFNRAESFYYEYKLEGKGVAFRTASCRYRFCATSFRSHGSMTP